MGANASKSSSRSSKTGNNTRVNQQKIEDLVDLGGVFPNGLYPTTEQDYDPRKVRSIIIARKMAPFYKGLSDAPETVVDSVALESPPSLHSSCSLSTITTADNMNKKSSPIGRPRSASSSSRAKDYDPYLERKKAYLVKMKQREKMLYNDAVECPICFLYYPANTNYSRCCDQPICTECFVQIHRPVETPMEPATCPFCMQENYGVVYEPPSWSEKFQARSRSGSHSGTRHTTSGVGESDGPRRESVSHQSPDVVLVDHIRPNWEANVKAATPSPRSRRNSASARSGSNNNNNNNNNTSSLLRVPGVNSIMNRPGRSASSAAATEYNQFLSNVRGMNMDLEDWMVMEAIRLSLAEQEEKDRQEALKKSKQEAERASSNQVVEGPSSSSN